MVLSLVDLGYVHTKADSFCTAMKIIVKRACAHSQERLWWHDFCDGAKLRSARLLTRVWESRVQIIGYDCKIADLLTWYQFEILTSLCSILIICSIYPWKVP